MDISSAMVKALREKTGLPMMECKKALEEAHGDEKLAYEILRKKGMSQVAKRADKETSEGRLFFQSESGSGRAALIELLCETAPVAKTDDFIKLGQAAAAAAAKLGTPNMTAEQILAQPVPGDPAHKVEDLLHDAVNKIRENLRFGRIGVVSSNVGHYLHHDGRKGVLVEFNAACPADVAADVCMHIVAMRPTYNRREEVDPALVEQERRIATEQVQGKPANIIEKIVTGKLDRWYSETVLLEQLFVKDDKKSVGAHLRGVDPNLTVSRFIRLEIGEG
jgi:elongation factor Ts